MHCWRFSESTLRIARSGGQWDEVVCSAALLLLSRVPRLQRRCGIKSSVAWSHRSQISFNCFPVYQHDTTSSSTDTAIRSLSLHNKPLVSSSDTWGISVSLL